MAVFYERGGIMQELENILKEIDTHAIEFELFGTSDDYISVGWVKDIIRKHISGKDINVTTNNGWIPVEERLPEEKRANYEVTFINECGYKEHGFAQWYDGEFHIPAVVIAWRDHLNPYCPEKR